MTGTTTVDKLFLALVEYPDGMSAADLAKKLDVTVWTVQRAVRKLRLALGDGADNVVTTAERPARYRLVGDPDGHYRTWQLRRFSELVTRVQVDNAVAQAVLRDVPEDTAGYPEAKALAAVIENFTLVLDYHNKALKASIKAGEAG